MATTIKLKRGTSTACDSYNGPSGELVYDTSNHSLRIYDGLTTGGHQFWNGSTADSRYLKLSGGQMNGLIYRNVDNSYMVVGGGTNWNHGSFIKLYGKDETTYGGCFELIAHNGTSSYILSGKPDGSLTQAGNTMLTTANGLPLSGGLMTGSIRFANGSVVNGYNELLIMAETDGNDRGTRSTVALRGPSHSSAGSVCLCARTDSSQKYFEIRPDGNTYWGGTLFAVNFQINSDIRLKSQLTKIEDSLTRIRKLTGYTYNLKDVETRQAGLIAQDVETVLPEAVSENNDHYKTINYNSVTAMLVNAVNQLADKVEALEKQ